MAGRVLGALASAAALLVLAHGRVVRRLDAARVNTTRLNATRLNGTRLNATVAEVSGAADDKPRHKHNFTWRGEHPARPVVGNPWADTIGVHGQFKHAQASADSVEHEVAKEMDDNANAPRLTEGPNLRPRDSSMHALVGHFSKEEKWQRQLRRAAAPGPAPAPWSEDPEWVADGARGDKSQTVPITNQFQGLESDGAPEQGYHGRPVQHDNMETYTGDWNNEFGPKVRGAWEVCQDEHNRNGYWCRTHMKELEPGIQSSAPGGLRVLRAGLVVGLLASALA